jgi:rhodanese-related sulfurtransferase
MRDRIDVREIIIILVAGCCMGMVFNTVHKNKIPFITPSKAEIYAQKNIPTLTMEKAKAEFDRGVAIFLDARDREEYEEGHVRGALSLPVRHIEIYYPGMKKLLPKEAHIIVYCASPECNASLYLAEELVKLRYEHIEVMLGGWEEWEELGYPDEVSSGTGT